jgi:hypothetical protein
LDKHAIERKNWREYYDVPSETMMKIKDLPDYSLDEDGNLQIDINNIKSFQRMKDVFEAHQLKSRGIDLEKLGGMIGYERQVIRESQGSINTRGGNDFD